MLNGSRGQGPGRATAREWRRLGLSPFTKIHPTRTPKPDNTNVQRGTRGGRGRDTETQRDPRRANPPGGNRDLGAYQGRKRGGETGTGKAADSGTRRGAQV